MIVIIIRRKSFRADILSWFVTAEELRSDKCIVLLVVVIISLVVNSRWEYNIITLVIQGHINSVLVWKFAGIHSVRWVGNTGRRASGQNINPFRFKIWMSTDLDVEEHSLLLLSNLDAVLASGAASLVTPWPIAVGGDWLMSCFEFRIWGVVTLVSTVWLEGEARALTGFDRLVVLLFVANQLLGDVLDLGMERWANSWRCFNSSTLKPTPSCRSNIL